MLVALNIVGALSGFLTASRMAQQGLAEALELAGVQSLVLLLGPRVRSSRMAGIEGLGHLTQVLLDVKPIDDFYRPREEFLSQVPDPGSAIGQHHSTRRLLEAAPLRLAPNPLREIGGLGVSIRRDGTFNRCRIGDRSLVAHRLPFGVAGFSAPDGAQLHLPGFRRAVSLLASAAP